MLYYLFQYLENNFNLPGAGVFEFISFRAAMAVLFSLLISWVFGQTLIDFLRKKQIGETVRDLGLEGQKAKEGTPTMGGLIILSAIVIPVLLFAKLENIYILLMLLVTVWMGMIGFLDDYIKVFKKDKEGLAGKFKIIGQIGVGLIVGIVLYTHEDVVVRMEVNPERVTQSESANQSFERTDFNGKTHYMQDYKLPVTTIPFFKNNELNYSKPLAFLGEGYEKWAWIVFIPIVIFIVTAVSNGANMTDGLDGLATGISAIIGATLGLFAYISGNIIF